MATFLSKVATRYPTWKFLETAVAKEASPNHLNELRSVRFPRPKSRVQILVLSRSKSGGHEQSSGTGK